MAIRNCALENDAFIQLKKAFNAKELGAKDLGKKAALIAGSDFPEEILVAAGVRPIRLSYCLKDVPTPVADKYLEGRVMGNRPLMNMFENLVNGHYAKIADKLFITNSDGTSYGLFNVLRELKRNLKEADIPDLYFLDIIIHNSEVYKKRNVRKITELKEYVENWTGVVLTEERLRNAIDICNEDRSAMSEFDTLRRIKPARVTGTEALVVMASSLFMDKKEHARLVRKLAQDAVSWPDVEGKRLFITGSDHQTTDVYEKIEASGFVITGEDHNWGSRIYQYLVPFEGDPTEALTRRINERPKHSTRALVSERVKELSWQVKQCNADSLLCFLFRNDTWACWDYPEEKKAMTEKGVKCAFIQNQSIPAANDGELEEVIKEL